MSKIVNNQVFFRAGNVPVEQVTIRVCCVAFDGDGRRNNLIRVSSTGDIRVYDDVAKFFTLCHSLTARQQARIRVLARKHLASL